MINLKVTTEDSFRKAYGRLPDIISTTKGVMSDVEARKNNVGGEILCEVF